MIVPTRMNGVRRPRLLVQRSEIDPNRGSRNSAKILSSAITMPEAACAMPNLSVRIFGMIVSYACQKVQIRKKANPTKMVRL